MKYLYYPGCTLKTQAKNFEFPALESARLLGIDILEMPKWYCCGTVFSLASDDLIHYIAPIRNLTKAKENGYDAVVTLCAMCYNTLKSANSFVNNNRENLNKINQFMDEEKSYDGTVKVVHFSTLLKELGFENIKQKIKKPLTTLKISAYYGCLLVRPKEIAVDEKYESPEILEELLESLGAEVIDSPYKTECCGSYQTVYEKDIVAERAGKIADAAVKRGADAIAVSCPLCFFNLDSRQKQIPVFYFTQLLALALGTQYGKCGFELHHINPVPLLKARRLIPRGSRK